MIKPDSWLVMPLGQVVTVLDSMREPINRGDRDLRSGVIPYYGATGQVGWIDKPIFDEELVLLGEDGAPFFDKSRNVAYMINGKSWVNNHAHVLRAGDLLCNRFLLHQLNYVNYRPYVSGTTRAKLPQGPMRAIPILLPPKGEQDRIVAEIEKQFTRLDDAVTTLERVKSNLRRARASVLKAAVEGRLVPTEAELARAEGRDFEPASVLLARILDERKARWPKGKKYKTPPTPDISGMANTPEGWTWASMDQISWGCGYGTSVKCEYSAKGPPVLRIPNIQGGNLDLGDIKFATDPAGLKADGHVESGDLLFIRTNGSLNLIGLGTVIVDTPLEQTWFASYLIRFRLCGPRDLWRWIGLAWGSRVVRRYVERDAASSAGQFNVSLSSASSYQIPIPPLAEQRRIVAEVERQLTILDSIAATIDRRLATCTHLRQSILKRAFEGKLVPQDPNDEPASALLARIQKPAKGPTA